MQLDSTEEKLQDRIGVIIHADNVPLATLDLSVRTYNALTRGGVKTVGDLARLSFNQLYAMRNVGSKTAEETLAELTAFVREGHVSTSPRPEVYEPVQQSLLATRPIASQEALLPDPRQQRFEAARDDPTPVLVLQLSRRAENALVRARVNTIGRLARLTHETLLNIYSLGPTLAAEIDAALDAYTTAGADWKTATGIESGAADLLVDATGPDERQLRWQSLTANATPLAVLRLSRRTHNALVGGGYVTIGQVAAARTTDLLAVGPIGSRSLHELETQLGRYLIDLTGPFKAELSAQPDRSTSLSPEIPPVLRDAPLEHIAVDRLGLPAYIRRRIKSSSRQTIADLVEQTHSPAQYYYEVNVALSTYLSWLAGQPAERWEEEANGIGPSPMYRLLLASYSMSDLVGEWLATLDARMAQVVELRYGLYRAPYTLQEVGHELEVTRERARQIEKKAMRKLSGAHIQETAGPIYAFAALLQAEIRSRGGIMSIDECVTWMRTEGLVALGPIRPEGLVGLLAAVDDRFQLLHQSQLLAIKGPLLPYMPGILSAIVETLMAEKAPTDRLALLSAIHETELYCRLAEESSEQDAADLEAFVAACLRTHPALEEVDPGRYGLLKWRSKIVDETVDALRQMGEPAHYSIIAEWVNMLLPVEKRTTAHNIHAMLGRLPDLFVRVGHGIFGLAEWGLVNDGSVANAAARVLREAGHPLHINAITEEVLKTWRVKPSSVMAAIQNDERFVGLGGGVYMLQEDATARYFE